MRLASARHPLLLASAFLALTAGCTRPIYTIDSVIAARSCVNDARAIRFLVDTGGASSVTWEGGSANIVGDPSIADLGPGILEVTAELDSVPIGDEVTLHFSLVGVFPASGQVSDIAFYTVPPPGLPQTPDCAPGGTPDFTLLNDVHLGLTLQVSNPSPRPMTLALLQLAEVPGLLPKPMLDWSDPTFNALPWQTALPGNTPLDFQAPPQVIELPGQAGPATQGTLLRFISIVEGEEFRGIVQVDLNGIVAAQPTTWSAVKSKYRN